MSEVNWYPAPLYPLQKSHHADAPRDQPSFRTRPRGPCGTACVFGLVLAEIRKEDRDVYIAVWVCGVFGVVASSVIQSDCNRGTGVKERVATSESSG